MKHHDQSRLVAVFSGQRMEAEIIKGMLEANGIPAMLKDESIGGIISPYLSAEYRGIKVLVNPEDEAAARQLIQNPDTPAET